MSAFSLTRVLAAAGLVLALPALAGCSTSVPAVDPVASASPGQPVAAFYGDSYTRGTGASDPALRWSSRICEERGWAELNPSVDGLGYVINRGLIGEDLVEAIVAEEPDIVIVTMGLNDNFAMPDRAAELEEAIRDDLATFAEELPDARLIVVEPFWHLDERPASVGTINDWVESAAQDAGADYIAGASRWMAGHPEWLSIDGVHPNDEGYAAIATRMDEELTKLGL